MTQVSICNQFGPIRFESIKIPANLTGSKLFFARLHLISIVQLILQSDAKQLVLIVFRVSINAIFVSILIQVFKRIGDR
jgi:hypothetical protein